MDYGGDWIRRDSNFDNIYQAMLTMFKISITEGWIGIMYQAIDSNGPEKIPSRDFNRSWGMFFCVFITVGAFFILNIFDNIIIESYRREKDKFDDLDKYTSD